MNADVDIRAETGNTARDPSDDELVPQVSDETPLARSLFLMLDSTRNIEKQEENTKWTCPNPSSPKRDGEPLSGPDPRRARTGDATDSRMEDKSCTERRTVGLSDADVVVTVTREQLNLAGTEPDPGRPAYEIIYPMGNPLYIARDPSFATKNYRNL